MNFKLLLLGCLPLYAVIQIKTKKVLGSLPCCRVMQGRPTELIITKSSIINVPRIVFAPLRAAFQRHASFGLLPSHFSNPAFFQELKMNPSRTSSSGRTFLFTSESVGEGHAGTSVDVCGHVYPLMDTSANHYPATVEFNSNSNCKTASLAYNAVFK